MTRDQVIKAGSKTILGASGAGAVAFLALLFSFQDKVDARQDQAIQSASAQIDKYEASVDRRLERIEKKIDKLTERVLRRR